MSGAGVAVHGLTWRPVGRRRPTLNEIDLVIEPGQRVLLAGPSGSGKSTLLRALAGVLLSAAQGELTGSVLVDGQPPGHDAGRVGLLLQDPGAAIVAATCGRDVAFGLENRSVPRSEIWPRVAAALTEARFPYGVRRATAALSGGEQQSLALAGILAMGSDVVLLDEPTSMLDPETAYQVRSSLQEQIAARGSTAIVVAHRMEPWIDFVDRLVVMGQGGRIIADGEPRLVLAQQSEAMVAQGVWVPGRPAPDPVEVPAGLAQPREPMAGDLLRARDLVVRLKPAWSDRDRTQVTAIDGVDASLTAGTCLAVTGDSGAGKSTLLAVLAGLVRPSSGEVRAHEAWRSRRAGGPWRWPSRDLAARLAWVPQLPEVGLVGRSVRDEALATSRALGRDDGNAGRRVDDLLELVGLSRLAAASPYHLSGGEQRRLTVVAALAHGPAGVLLDEPTVGQDRLTWAALTGLCAAARAGGAGVAISTHDRAAVEHLADGELRLQAGQQVPV